ncbi:MAG: transglycosylase SLT domain-containing protein [Lysobacteraceae bacterium]
MYRIAIVLLSAAALSSCATGTPMRSAHGSTGRSGVASVDALYDRLDRDTRNYNAGLDQLAAGDTDSGRRTVDTANADLLDAASRCQVNPQCDGGRFIAAYDALLKRGMSDLGNGGESFADVDEDAGRPSSSTRGGSPVIANLPAAGATVVMLKGRDLRQIITINEPTKAALTEWLTSNRAQLIDAWENYQYMRQLMWPEYQRAGLPEALLFGIMAQESGGKVHAVSRSGAGGPLQFMPATGQRFGLGNSGGFDTRFDPQLSTRANVQFLNERFSQLNNNLELAVAAYNGGEGKIGRLYSSTGGKGFWDPEVYSQLSPETRDYVPRVLAAAWLFLNPREYGLQFPRVNAGEPVVLTLGRDSSINALTICLGNTGVRDGWFRALRNLNPRYEPHTMIPAGTSLRVPPLLPKLYRTYCAAPSPRAQLAADLVAARKPVVISYSPPPSFPAIERPLRESSKSAVKVKTYKVKRGDTMASIMRKMRCDDIRELGSANGLRAPYAIRPGQTLKLVGCDR